MSFIVTIKRRVVVVLCLLELMRATTAFAPVTNTFAPARRVTNPVRPYFEHPIAKNQKPSTTSLFIFGNIIPSVPDPDLIVGFVTIAAACTPYVLGIFFPDFFEDKFYLPIYTDTEEGRAAEIGWKVRYAALALAITTLTALEVLFAADRTTVQILRDSYILWAIFYTEAVRKIRSEAKEGILRKPEKRLGIQLWHILVVIVLWADISASPTGNAITDFLKDVFT